MHTWWNGRSKHASRKLGAYLAACKLWIGTVLGQRLVAFHKSARTGPRSTHTENEPLNHAVKSWPITHPAQTCSPLLSDLSDFKNKLCLYFFWNPETVLISFKSLHFENVFFLFIPFSKNANIINTQRLFHHNFLDTKVCVCVCAIFILVTQKA